MKAFTWNVGSSSGYNEFDYNSFGLPTEANATASSLPHVMVFGFQEAPTFSGVFYDDPYVIHLTRILEPYRFIKLESEKLQGLLLVTFIHSSIITQVRNYEKTYVKTGFGGLWGNKGAVAQRFSLTHPPIHLCIVNAHLAAHDHKLDQRISDYQTIINSASFNSVKYSKILAHNEIIFLGDLNFRIEELSPQEIQDKIIEGSDNSRRQLLARDQLNRVREEKSAFAPFNEQSITFWPTYKFKSGTSNYDLKRRPSYTDRILFKGFSGRLIESANSAAIDKHATTVQEYKRHMDFYSSDHKPVSAYFSIDLQSKDTIDSFTSRQLLADSHVSDRHYFVLFERITHWTNDSDNSVVFTFKDANGHLSTDFISSLDRSWDWVAVYPENLNDLDKWICYNYANHARVNEATVQMPYTHLVLTMNCILAVASPYRLVYFQDINGARSVLGVSEPFVVEP